MALDLWTNPDPNYFPVTPVGEVGSLSNLKFNLDLDWIIKDIIEDNITPGSYIYKAEITGAGKIILGSIANRKFSLQSIDLDQYNNLWIDGNLYPANKIGDTFIVTLLIKVISVYRSELIEHNNAYVHKLELSFSDQFKTVFEVMNKPFESIEILVLSKGLDNYLKQTGVI